MKIEDNSGDRKYFTIIPNYILNHSTHWDREVYIQMKRIAGETGTCWVSQKNLADRCGFSVNRVKQSITYLVDHKWIKKIGTKPVNTKGGKQSVNEYVIVDLWNTNNEFYKSKGVSRDDTPKPKGVSRKSQRGITDKPKGVSPESYKEEPIKEEPIKEDSNDKSLHLDVSLIIDKFSKFNPICKNYYQNKTQRKACKFLIEEYGIDKVLKVVELLPKTNQMTFIPTITTPHQLQEKWTQLESSLLKKKGELLEKNNKFKVAFT